MGLGRLLRTDLEDAEYIAATKADLENQMLEVHRQLEVYYTEGALAYENLLRAELQSAMNDMMTAEGEGLLLARERARLVSRVLRKKDDLEADLSRLREERQNLGA